MDVSLIYDKGYILVKGLEKLPLGWWDQESGCPKVEAYLYDKVLDFLKEKNIRFRDSVLKLPSYEKFSFDANKLRSYQLEALNSWEMAGRKGIVILPTAAGKTVLAIAAIATVNAPALIIVPTIDLMNQTKQRIEEALKVSVGRYGGGFKEIKSITVSTYDSSYLKAYELGNKFALIIFDECHHVNSPTGLRMAKMYVAPFRLGLTATLNLDDGIDGDLFEVVGKVVYRRSAKDLAGTYLAPFEIERIKVPMTNEERIVYEQNYNFFKSYLEKVRFIEGDNGFEKLIKLASKDPEARQALISWNKALDVALNSKGKIEATRKILKENEGRKTIIFTKHNSLVYRIAREFLIPYITHRTPKEERHKILEGFRKGDYQVIATSKVLEEGIDVPDASLIIVLSGTSSKREYIQRLGRALRPSEGKKAKLVEVVTSGTKEVYMSIKRSRATGEV